MNANLLNTVITDVETIENLPVGAILLEQIAQHPGHAMAWRKERDGWWYPSTFSWVRQRGALAMAGVEPTLIWLPTGSEATTEATDTPAGADKPLCASALQPFHDHGHHPVWPHITYRCARTAGHGDDHCSPDWSKRWRNGDPGVVTIDAGPRAFKVDDRVVPADGEFADRAVRIAAIDENHDPDKPYLLATTGHCHHYAWAAAADLTIAPGWEALP